MSSFILPSYGYHCMIVGIPGHVSSYNYHTGSRHCHSSI